MMNIPTLRQKQQKSEQRFHDIYDTKSYTTSSGARRLEVYYDRKHPHEVEATGSHERGEQSKVEQKIKFSSKEL